MPAHIRSKHRPIFALALLGSCINFLQFHAQQACVLSPEGDVVCGQLVQPGYAPPPPREYYGPVRPFGGREFHTDERQGPPPGPPKAGPGPAPKGPPLVHCQPGFVVHNGVCKHI